MTDNGGIWSALQPPKKGRDSAISAGRAYGATAGAMVAVTIALAVALPPLAAASAFAAGAVAGSLAGGRMSAQKVLTADKLTWDGVDLLQRILVDLGVPESALGRTMAAVISKIDTPQQLADPQAIVSLLPEDVFKQSVSERALRRPEREKVLEQAAQAPLQPPSESSAPQ